MVMAQHTPGPWVQMRVERVHDYAILRQISANAALKNPVLCMVSNDGIAQAECEANAHLIAAAPDLYVHGNELAAAAADVHPTAPSGAQITRLHAALGVFEDILAKAEGRT